jgi:hypothetical protein
VKTRSLAIAAALLLSTVVVPQSHAQQLEAKIPFAFTVGDKTLPAGEYRIRPVLSDGAKAQLIQRTDGSGSAIVMTLSTEDTKESEAKLVFNRYGHEYFLSRILAGEGVARKVQQSRREKELAVGEASSEMALLLNPASIRP